MARKKAPRASREAAESEHRWALDDLQDAVDRTMENGDFEERMTNLRRARLRESDAHDALGTTRRRPTKDKR